MPNTTSNTTINATTETAASDDSQRWHPDPIPLDPSHPGLFISLEGMDGAGKSTCMGALFRLTMDMLRAQALQLTPHGDRQLRELILMTREPGGTPLAEQLRLDVKKHDMSPMAELLLMNAARLDHVEKVIRPHLQRGGVVLCDRYVDSTFAYQGARGVSHDAIAQMHDSLIGLNPDITIYLDVDLAVSRQRRGERAEGTDRLEEGADAAFEAMRSTFLQRAQQEPERFVVIDANGTLQAVEDAIRAGLEQALRAMEHPLAPGPLQQESLHPRPRP